MIKSGSTHVVTPASINAATSNPLAITTMEQKLYPGSAISIEEKLSRGSNYNRYLVSYQSDRLKQYGLLTVPIGAKPIST